MAFSESELPSGYRPDKYQRYRKSEKGRAYYLRAKEREKTPEALAKRRARRKLRGPQPQTAAQKAAKRLQGLRRKGRRQGDTLRKFGLSVKDYAVLLAAQRGVCKICKLPPTGKGAWGRPRILVVDHDHADGRLRGLLCQHCNIALGGAKDRQDLLFEMIRYLSVGQFDALATLAKNAEVDNFVY